MNLEELTDEMIVSLLGWVLMTCHAKERDADSVRSVSNALVVESERRGWPEGWWEDPSVIPSIEAAYLDDNPCPEGASTTA